MGLVDNRDTNVADHQCIGQQLSGYGGRIAVAAMKCIGKTGLQRVERCCPRKPADRCAPCMVKLAKVIDAVTMVRVIVCPDDRIKIADLCGKQLFAHIGTGIDKDACGRRCNQNRGARSAIAGFRGVASPPIIADPRDSG